MEENDPSAIEMNGWQAILSSWEFMIQYKDDRHERGGGVIGRHGVSEKRRVFKYHRLSNRLDCFA